MISRPLASIVISSYNYARFLPQCIESALSQTHRDVEVIVVDDGSSDDSPDVIARYGDRVVAIIKQNGGQASAFNAGFARSRGEIVLFLDSDDVLLPAAVARAVECFRQSSDSVRVHWPMYLIDENGARTGEVMPSEPLPDGDLRDDVILNGPRYDAVSPTTGNAWSRRFLQQVLPMPEPEFRISPDLYLFALSPVYGPMRRIGEPQACYRAHGENHGWGTSLVGQKLDDDLRRVECAHRVTASHLRRAGVTVDAEAWEDRNWNYKWIRRLAQAKQDLLALLPERATFALIDGGEWGGQLVPGRSAISFPERDGRFDGPPADDVAAITELDRLRARGADFLVVWWTAFWWLDHYAAFSDHVRDCYALRASNERLLVFDLRPRIACANNH